MSRDSRIARIRQWEHGERPGPWSMTVFPTNKCNLPCKHCWLRWGDYDRTYETEMPDGRLLELVDEAAALGVRDWTIVGGGDPMVRGDLVIEMCRRIRARGMDGMLHTNGTLFKPGQLEALIEMDWGRVAISLDGPDAASNNEVRGAGFAKAIKNMSKLHELRADAGTLRPDLSIHCVITNLNYNRIDELVELAHGTGCDTVNLTLLLVESEGSEPFATTPAQKAELKDHLRVAGERAKQLCVSNNFDVFLRDEILADSTHMPHGVRVRREPGIARALCFEPFSAVTIHPNGLVGPCCAFWDVDANSIKDKSLREVWLGPYLEALRGDFLVNKPKPYCEKCPSSLYARIQDTRAQVVAAGAPWPRRMQHLFSKGVHSLQADGLRSTMRRGWRWAQRAGIH